MFYTYIITNRLKGKLYTGHTEDLVQRMEQHRYQLFEGYAAKHHCQYLLWYEEHESRHKAFIRERRIKKWKREWKINLIEQQNPEWLDIMRCPTWPLPEGELLKDVRLKAFRDAKIPIGKPPHLRTYELTESLSLL